MIEDKLDKIISLLQTIAGAAALDQVTDQPEKQGLAMLAKAEAKKQDAASKVPYAKEEKGPQPLKEEKEPQPPKEEKITKETLADAVRAACAVHGAEKVKTVIATFGVQRATLAPEADWPKILVAVKGIA